MCGVDLYIAVKINARRAPRRGCSSGLSVVYLTKKVENRFVCPARRWVDE